MLQLILRDRCYWCRRREPDVNVSLEDGRIVGCCDTCWERGRDEIRIPLDMTEDEGDDDGEL
jgi:hypothetical protein